MNHRRRMLLLLPVLALLALVIPSSAFGQATRTWVSGVGDDANPCSRTAPCKTFAGAISKTAAGGIIDAMDDGGFGALTITKAITVDGGGHVAGLLASGGINAINVNAGVSDKVVLRNLDIEGNGTTLGLNGVRITQAKSVKIYDSNISHFSRSGVTLEPNAGTSAKLLISRSSIYNNGGSGLNVAPGNSANAKAWVRNSEFDENTCGMTAASWGMSTAFNFVADCATASAASGIAGTPTINAFHSSFTDNASSGVLSRGNFATIRMGFDEVTGSLQGLNTVDAGAAIQTFGNNMVTNNTNNGIFTSGIPLSRPIRR